jgi:hypothetical protein
MYPSLLEFLCYSYFRVTVFVAPANTGGTVLGKTLGEFRLSPPSLAEIVRAYEPEAGHRSEFLASFPEDAADFIVFSMQQIIHKYFPGATKNREGEVAIIYRVPGVEMPG